MFSWLFFCDGVFVVMFCGCIFDFFWNCLFGVVRLCFCGGAFVVRSVGEENYR